MAFALLTLVLLAEGSMADWGLETRILDTIQNVAEVVAKESYLLVDAYYGLTLAEAQMKPLVEWVWSQGAENCPIGEYIEETEAKLRKALKASEAMKDSDIPLWRLINPEIWEITGHRRRLPLRNKNYIAQLSDFSHYQDLSDFAMQGTPTGEQSDHCMNGVITACEVSLSCWHAQTSIDPPPRGYPLTHRLLFLLVSRQLGCGSAPAFANVSINAEIRNLCDKILIDSKTIEMLDYPSRLRDLFTEQITLCGMDGFREFTNRKWIEKVLSWQLPSGCFPDFASRSKRNDLIVGDCSLHFSGLAAGALSIALRNMMEDTKLRYCMKE